MAPAALRSRPGGADHEARLARAAAEGDARAFATLYGRYEERAFNLALRVGGSRDQAAGAVREAFLDALRALPHLEPGAPFGTLLFTAIRNLSGGERDAGRESADGPESADGGRQSADSRPAEADPDDAAELMRIRDACARLAERELLALGALELSYDEIGAIVDADRDAVPALIARARLSLRDELRGTSLASTPAASPECKEALALIAMRDDGRLDDEEELQWLLDHLAHCGECRKRLDAMEEAAAAYDAWRPVAAPPTLFAETMAGAAELAGGDWGELRDARAVAAVRANTDALGSLRETALATGVLGLLRAGSAIAARTLDRVRGSAIAARTLDFLRGTAAAAATDRRKSGPGPSPLVTAGLVLLILLGLSGVGAGATLVLRADDRPKEAEAEAPPEPPPPTPVQRLQPKPDVAPAERTKKLRTAPPAVEVTAPDPVPVRPAPDQRPRGAVPRRVPIPTAEAVPLPKPAPPATQQPAPTRPPPAASPQPVQPQPSLCTDATGKAVACPG